MGRALRPVITGLWGALLLIPGTAASADETITYTYDALGRLVQVSRAGTVNNGVQAAYAYDKADNRTQVTVTGAPTPPPPAPSFSISDAAALEGEQLIFTVTKTGSTTSTITMNFASANGTALAGSDYSPVTGTLSFSPSETTKEISVWTLTDNVVESAEDMTVTLSNVSGGATLSRAQAIGQISDPLQECWEGGVRVVCPIEPMGAKSTPVPSSDTEATGGQ